MGVRKFIKSNLDIFEPGPAYYVNYHGFGGYLGFADYETNSEDGFRDYSAITRPYISHGGSGVVDDDDTDLDPNDLPDDLAEFYYNLNFASSGAITVEDALADNFPSLRVVPEPVNCAILLPGFSCVAHHVPGTGKDIQWHTIDRTTDPPTRGGFIDVDLNFFVPFGAYQDYWTDGFNGTYFTWKNMPRIFNQASENPWLKRSLLSCFNLPSDPVFALALWTTEDRTGLYGTRLWFGADVGYGGDGWGYSYTIPNGSGKPQMFWHDDITRTDSGVPLRRVGNSEGGSAGGSMGGGYKVGNGEWTATTEMSAQVVFIGFFGPYIAVSGDGFATISDVYYRTIGEPTLNSCMGQYLPCAPSPVGIDHTGGQFAFAWLPLFTPEVGVVYSPVHALPFPLDDMEAAGAEASYFNNWVTGPSTVKNTGGVYQLGAGMVGSYKCGAPFYGALSNSRCEDGHGFDFSTQIARTTFISPFKNTAWAGSSAVRAFNRTSATYYHDQGACLFRVDYRKDNILSQKSPRTYSRFTPLSFSYDVSKDGNAAEVSVDGVSTDDGDYENPPFVEMQDGVSVREVRLANQWYDANGVVAEDLIRPISFGGYMNDPQVVIENGKVLTSIQLRDFQSAGLDVVVDGKLPVFDGWLVYDAVVWLLSYMGIGPDQRTYRTRAFIPDEGPGGGLWGWVTADSIENTGMYLNIGPTDKPFWVAEEGRPVMDLIAEMCIYDYGAALFCHNGLIAKCCPHCTTRRNGVCGAVDNVWQHVSGGPYSPGCVASDIALSPNGDGIFHYFTTAEGDEIFKLYVPDAAYLPLKHEITKIETQPFDISEYYNSVKVKGKSFVYNGEPRDVEITDWASVRGGDIADPTGYSLGRKKTLELSYEWANSDAVRQRIASVHYRNASKWKKTITVNVPYDPNYRIGDTFAVFGPIAEYAKARNRVFRIVSIEHSNEASRVATSTTLRGRYIWDIA